MTDEDESAVDDNNISVTCNICRQSFKNKADMNVHVKSAHFGMKDNKDSLVVVNLDDEPDEEASSDSDDGMTLDSDSVCGVCFSIFKDSTDLESHIRLAHDNLGKISESLSCKSKDDVVEKAANVSNSTAMGSSDRAEAKLPEPEVVEPDGRREVHDNTNKIGDKSNDCVSRDLDVFEYKGDDSSEDDCQQTQDKPGNDGNKNVLVIDDQKDTVIIDDADDGTTDSNIATVKKYERVICNICVKEFENKDILTLHIRSDHFGISSYKCAMCSLSFENRNEVIKHYNECTGTPVDEKSGLPGLVNSRVSEKLASKVKAKAKKAKRLSKKYLMNKIGSAKKEKKKPVRDLKRRSSSRIAELNSRKASENYERRSISASSRETSAKNKRNKKALKKCSFKEKNHESIRPCFICGEKYLRATEINEHMLKKHCDYGKLTASDLSAFKHLKPNEKFKCLRCGKVGLLHVIQLHLQEKCVRAPFQGITVPKSYFCSVCGEYFSDAKSHDFHVASAHYPHLFNPNFKHFASIPYPHVLLYHISPDVCQHCGQTCQNTVKWNKFSIQPNVQCIKGPYVCPYPHSRKQSMCTLDLLLHHVKFCRYKAGVLALQCNNCFKMLLCNNSPKQIDQLKEVIKMPQLECCQNDQKSFKCYCCTRDYTWSVVTQQLKASINRLDSIRSNSKVYGTVYQNKILKSNPSIHTKCPQFKRFSHAAIDLDQADCIKRAVEDSSLERKRRATSFDRVQRNLAQMKQDNCRVFEYSDQHSDKSNAGQSEGHENAVEDEVMKKDVILQPKDAIRIQNTFSRPLEPISNQVDTNQTMANPVADDVPALRNVRTYTDTDHMEHRKTQLKSGIKKGLFSKALAEPPGYIIEEVELIPERKENLGNLKQRKSERLINLSQADKISKHFKPSVEEPLGTKFEKDCSRESLKDSSPKILSGLTYTTCSICTAKSSAAKRVFFDSKSIVRHMAEHKEQQKFTCYDCYSSFDNQSLWKQHITEKHPQCLILECDYKDCTLEFQRPQDLQKHIFSEHCHMFGCAECLAQFNTEKELISHADAMHV